ncbi:hypothetical protein NKJ71_19710 [Mesorhizobium sp. M0050]|uniref:hypothetical protein n=1 Tax=Mesorhizobium sp. M0050 TaxID=2956861 RepID=UPI00333A89EE
MTAYNDEDENMLAAGKAMTSDTQRSELPDRIYVERDPETGEKRWFSIAGMGAAYVRVTPPKVGSGELDAAGLEAICKPWEFGAGDPPDYDSPLTGVYEAGISYAFDQLAGMFNVKKYTGSDGAGTLEGDVAGTLQNILIAAGFVNADGDLAAPVDHPEVVGGSVSQGAVSLAAMVAEWYANSPSTDIPAHLIEKRIRRFAALAAPSRLLSDRETLRRKIEADGEEGEIGAGYEMFAAPVGAVSDAYPSKDEFINSLLRQIADMRKCRLCGAADRCEACTEVNEIGAKIEADAFQSHIGHSLENDTWFVRFYPFASEDNAKAFLVQVATHQRRTGNV